MQPGGPERAAVQSADPGRQRNTRYQPDTLCRSQISGPQGLIVAVIAGGACHLEQCLLGGAAQNRIPGRRGQETGSAIGAGERDHHRRPWPLQDVTVGTDEDDVVGAEGGGMAQRGHVHRVGQRLGAGQQPRHGLDSGGRQPPVQQHRRHPIGAGGPYPLRQRADGQIAGRPGAALPAAAVDQPQRTLVESLCGPLPHRGVDGPTPGVRIGRRQIQHHRGVREPAQMRFQQAGTSVSHQQGLEDAVAAHRREIITEQQRLPRITDLAVKGDEHSGPAGHGA